MSDTTGDSRMTRSALLCSALLIALPVGIEVPSTSRDTVNTRVSVAGGIGTYALIARGCEGEILQTHRATYRDAGLSLEQRVAGPLRVDVHGGVIGTGGPEDGQDNRFVSPNLVLEWRRFELGAGPLFARNEFPVGLDDGSDFHVSWHLRIGDREVRYFTIAFLNDVPPYSAGGYLEVSLGFWPHAGVNATLGLSAGPYDHLGALLGADIRLSREFKALVRARLGESQGIGENAISLGLSYSILHHSRPAIAPTDQ
jgi:hypothetical protein